MTTTAASAAPLVPFAGFGSEAALDLDLGSPRVAAQVMARLLSPDFEDWSNAVAQVGRVHPRTRRAVGCSPVAAPDQRRPE